MIKKIIVALALCAPASAQGISASQYMCPGRPTGALEFTDAISEAGPVIETTFITTAELPNSWGVLFVGRDNIFIPQPGQSPTFSPICLTGPLTRTQPYLSDALGNASITIADTFMPGETYLVQRVHRAPNIGPVFNGMASGVALKFRMDQPAPPPPGK